MERPGGVPERGPEFRKGLERMADREYDGRGVVGMTFAAFMLVLIGIFEALDGLAAIIKDQFFVPTPNYWISLDVSAWGWITCSSGSW